MNITQIGLSGLMAAQSGLDITGRNTANMLTRGYSRQGVLLTPRPSGGVDVGATMRFNLGIHSQQMWRAQSDQYKFQAGDSYFNQLENIIGVGEGSARVQLDGFFASLDAATADPTNTALRQQIIASADSLAKSLSAERGGMQRQLQATQAESAAGVTQVNALAKTIADLNRAIADAEARGTPAHELMDQRDQAIDDLSALVQVDVLMQPNGTADISLAAGPPLVTGGHVGALLLTGNPDGTWRIDVDFAGVSYPVLGDQAGGSLGGLMTYAQNTLIPAIATHDSFVESLASTFNAQLAQGFGTNGSPGKPLFAYDPASGLLSADTTLAPAELGFSSAANEPGNNDNLLKLTALRTASVAVTGLGNVALADACSLLAGRIGSESQANQLALGKSAQIRQQAELERNAVSGVSSEEETVNFMEFVQMYQANMKVIATARELFDSTLQML